MTIRRFCDICDQPLRDEENVAVGPLKGDFNMARKPGIRRVVFEVVVKEVANNSSPDLCRSCLCDALARLDTRPREAGVA